MFKERVLRYLRAVPQVWCCKVQQVSIKGTPDILMCIAGVFVALELKTDTGVLSELQKHNLKLINSCGGFGIVLTPSKFEEFTNAIEDFTKGDSSCLRLLTTTF